MARMMASCRAHSRLSASTSADRCLGRSPPASMRRVRPDGGGKMKRGEVQRSTAVKPQERRLQPGQLFQEQSLLQQSVSPRKSGDWHSRVRRRLRACSSSRSAASCSASSARRRKARCARPRPPLHRAQGEECRGGACLGGARAGGDWQTGRRVEAGCALARQLSGRGKRQPTGSHKPQRFELCSLIRPRGNFSQQLWKLPKQQKLAWQAALGGMGRTCRARPSSCSTAPPRSRPRGR